MNNMLKTKRKHYKSKHLQIIDLSCRSDIKVVQVSNVKKINHEYEQAIQRMNEEIEKNMETYIKMQNEIIRSKIEKGVSSKQNVSMDKIREKYRDILDMHERIARKV